MFIDMRFRNKLWNFEPFPKHSRTFNDKIYQQHVQDLVKSYPYS